MVNKEALGLFDRAIKKGIEFFLLVEDLKDPKEKERRHNICKSNECAMYDAQNDKCLKCSCYLDLKTEMLKNKNPKKLGRIEITHCPMGKWGDKEIANYYRELDGIELIK